MDEKPPRRGQSQTDRDLAGIAAAKERARIAAHGVPVMLEPDEDFTPVGQILDKIADPELRDAVTAVWRHSANIELRARERAKDTDVGCLAERVGAAELAIVDIRGEHGNNGKLGEIRRRVEQMSARRWWFLTAIAGSLLAIGAGVLAAGRWVGAIETDVEVLKERFDRRSNASKETRP